MTTKCRSVYPKSQSKKAVEVVAHNQPNSRKIQQKAAVLIVLALGAIILVPDALAQDGREEGPFEIDKCQTISQPGSYRLVNNFNFTDLTGTCLAITANFVTIDLAGFTITGPLPSGLRTATAIAAQSSSGNLQGIAVRNGSISNFVSGVALRSADGSIVEGLRVFGGCPCIVGIDANGIVRSNIVVGIASNPATRPGIGIAATGIVTGNSVSETAQVGILAGRGSTVIGNTATNGPMTVGILVGCPSNVTDNTAVNNTGNLMLVGDGCTNTNNVAPGAAPGVSSLPPAVLSLMADRGLL